MKTLWFADLKHKASPARRAEIARAAKTELRLEDECPHCARKNPCEG